VTEEPGQMMHFFLAFLLVATIIWNFILLAIAFFSFILYLTYYTFSYVREEDKRGGQ
jgi:hypothetical protein